ncbi:hypothetical protein GCM10027430_31870 [Lysobacter tyrosinilyticus]
MEQPARHRRDAGESGGNVGLAEGIRTEDRDRAIGTHDQAVQVPGANRDRIHFDRNPGLAIDTQTPCHDSSLRKNGSRQQQKT